MAWTAPMTAISGSVFTAAQFNTFVRDNLNETAPAKATTEGRYFVAGGPNSISERAWDTDIINTIESTNSTSYTDLTTTGPSVTLTTGTSAFVFVTAQLVCDTSGQTARTTFAVSGATTRAELDSEAMLNLRVATGNDQRSSVLSGVGGLTPGSNTFTMKYRTSGASISTFGNRRILVMAF
jgi:hypothetical protein